MFWKKVNNTSVVPVSLKIVFAFAVFLLVSNLTSNYINLVFNRGELHTLMNELLKKDLKDIYSYSSNQFQIYQYDKNLDSSIKSIEKKGLYELKKQQSVVLGIKQNGEILFQSSKIKKYKIFEDKSTLKTIKQKLSTGIDEGYLNFEFNDENYFGIYKYNPKWKVFIVRAEEKNEFYSKSRGVFITVSIIIVLITILFSIVGIYILRFILRFVDVITSSIMKMVKNQEMGIIDLEGATNDDITYMGTAFNSLSSSIDNLISIFRKFANKDLVLKAYKEREIKLEGTSKELTILFTDIKSFTYITETLGNDIIKLLNLHYDRAIREILNYDGVIGSIIGDALLAVFGVLDDRGMNKSYLSVLAGYKIHEVTSDLQGRMAQIKEDIEREEGGFTPEEEKVYKAVLLEVGVGIDGGEVFYGTLGSYVRMTNTVIGDTVNASSRLEGLTRVYKIPVICSDYVMYDIENNVEDHGLQFIEIDTVQVKGKTKGKKVYWPIFEKDIDDNLLRQLKAFESGLALYYEGDWNGASKKFARCKLPLANVFKERTKESCPKKWNGIWEMKTK